jgi:hypothetical protein
MVEELHGLRLRAWTVGARGAGFKAVHVLIAKKYCIEDAEAIIKLMKTRSKVQT